MNIDKNIFEDVKYVPDQFGYELHIILKDGFVATDQIYGVDSQRELIAEVKQAVKDFLEWDGRSREVERVYSTRIDCMLMPEGVRRVAEIRDILWLY